MRHHAWFGGRLRIWWLMHGQEARNALYLTVIVVCYLLVSYWDTQEYKAAAAYERAMRKAIQVELDEHKAMARVYPSVTFIIEARTAKEFKQRVGTLTGVMADVKDSVK